MKTRGHIECQSAGWVLFSGGRRLVFANRGTSYRRIVLFVLVMQMGSSRRALAATWPGGSTVVYRGSPFGGSWTAARDVLRRHGIDAG